MTTLTHRGLAAILFSAMALFLCLAVAPAQAEEKAAESFVQDLGQEALDTLDQDVSEEQLSDEMRSWLNRYFDTDVISRFALGHYWRQADDAQKKEYNKLFNELIVSTYSRRLQEYSGEDFEVRGQTELNDRNTMVHSKIIPTKSGAPSTQVDWRVRKINGKLKIVDVNVEGVSMSVTQRNEFASVIKNNGNKIEALLDALRKKVGND
ncbi:MAG: MlaC/ttg2D family ABC transporter substrate-binding protein [Pseudomonadota bacterium]